MNSKISIYALLALLMSMFVVGCSDDDDQSLELDGSRDAVMINSFSLAADKDVLVNLDSVFFSIDLDQAIVFNADSLPKGTKVDSLVTTMTFSTVKKAEIMMPGRKAADTVVNYLSDPNEPINFTRGFVKLHLESASGEVSRDYTIYVNVHRVDPDKMEWSKLTQKLPTTLSAVGAQRTVECQGSILTFTTDGSGYCRATSADPTGSWSYETVDLPQGAQLETLTAGGDDLYVATAEGQLYQSADMGATWTATGTQMNYIYGYVGGTVVGAASADGVYSCVTYPETTSTPLGSDFPVEATAPAIVYTTEWSDQPMLITVGGLDAAGNAVSGAWAYDGGQWARLTAKLPALEAPVVVPYYTFRTSDTWEVTRRSVLLCYGGLLSTGEPNRKVYVSNDMGVNWAEGSEQMQLPAAYLPGGYAQAIVKDRVLGASRAVAPITEWNCPYIYMFGGKVGSTVSTDVWRGVVNRLEFKPLQ